MRDMTQLVNSHNPAGDAVSAYRDEVNEFLSLMQRWSRSDPDTVMREISAIAARLIEIRCHVVRSESRAIQAFRTKELDPLLDQVEFQFRVHSRRLSSMGLEWDMAKGG